MVLLEALARRRPVIIFDDIKHVIGEKKGIFVSRRNFISLFGVLNNIKKNYKKIQKDMKYKENKRGIWESKKINCHYSQHKLGKPQKSSSLNGRAIKEKITFFETFFFYFVAI